MTVLGLTKEILGVDNAQVLNGDGYQLPHGSIPPLRNIVPQLLIDPAAGPSSGPPVLSIQYPVSSIQHPAISHQHPASSIQHPASRNQSPVSRIQYPVSSIRYVHLLVTLCRFDDKLALRSKPGPFIPCERRLVNMEILGIQGRGFRPVI